MDSVLGQGNEFSEEQVESLIGLILTPGGGFWEGYRKIIAAASSSSLRSRLTGATTRIGDWASLWSPVEGSRAHQALLNRPPLSDRDYLNFLVQLKADRPAFGRVIKFLLSRSSISPPAFLLPCRGDYLLAFSMI